MSDPSISILMNCYNSEKTLKETLASVWKQTYTNWQLVFVDNHSTDNSVTILKEIAKGDERLVFVKTPKHMPLGEAREFGLAFCTGDYISFLDTDDIWLPEKLERQIETFECDPEICLCYTSAELINEKGNVFSKIKLKPKGGNLFGQNLANYEVNFQTVMIRKSVLERVDPPYFDPNLSFSPDHDLIMRVLAVGKAVSMEEILVSYRVRGGSLSDKTMHLWAKESAYTYRKLKKTRYVEKFSTKDQRIKALGQIALQKARFFIRTGERAKARLQLNRFKFQQPVVFLLWLACFFPWLTNILEMRKRIIQNL